MQRIQFHGLTNFLCNKYGLTGVVIKRKLSISPITYTDDDSGKLTVRQRNPQFPLPPPELCETEIKKMHQKQKNFGTYQIVNPRTRSIIPSILELRPVPPHIRKPEYYESGNPRTFCTPYHTPIIKSREEISKIRESCQLARFVLDSLIKEVKEGISTDELDCYAHELIITNGAYPSPLNYKGFPKSICTSVNNVAAHGIPDKRKLVSSDIINVDVTVYLDGYHGDCSETVELKSADTLGLDLVSATKLCLDEGIRICGPEVPFTAIGKKIESVAQTHGFTVVPSFAGHGIGAFFHEPPDIYHINYAYPGAMRPGMTFTIEPILSQGSQIIEIQKDGWTALTIDNSRTAQFEHTILITENGTEILTQKQNNQIEMQNN